MISWYLLGDLLEFRMFLKCLVLVVLLCLLLMGGVRLEDVMMLWVWVCFSLVCKLVVII